MKPLHCSALAAVMTLAAVPAAADDETVAQSPALDEAAATPNVHHGTVSVDPLGFLLFGPTVNADFALGRVAVGGGFRWLSPGVLANALFVDEDTKFAFSYGLALRANYFFTDRLTGPHAGLAFEFLHSRGENDDALIATISNYVIPQVEGGYRLAFGRFMVGGVLGFGYAAQTTSKVEDLPGGDSAWLYTVVDESSVYGTARLDLGLYF